jgi:hypothetical protein
MDGLIVWYSPYRREYAAGGFSLSASDSVAVTTIEI